MKHIKREEIIMRYFIYFLYIISTCTQYAITFEQNTTNEKTFPGKIRLVRRRQEDGTGTVGRSLSSWRYDNINIGDKWTGIKLPSLTQQRQLIVGTTEQTNINTRIRLPKRNLIPKFFESMREVTVNTPPPTEQMKTTITPTTSALAVTVTPMMTSLKRIVIKKYAGRKPLMTGLPSTTMATTTTTTTTTTTVTPVPISEENQQDISQSIETSPETITTAESSNELVIIDPNEVEEGRGASGIDPHHPAVKQAILSHQDRIQHSSPHHHQPHTSSHSHHSNSHHQKRVKHGHDTGLLPMDKTLVYVGMILSWIFWIVVFTTYYTWGQKYGHPVPGKPGYYKNKPVVLNMGGGHPHFVQTRSLDTDTTNTWNWPQVLHMITLAQESYEKFDLQSLECQKKALCELSVEGTESSKFIYFIKRLLDAIEGLVPIPTTILNYLKEYREAMNRKDECTNIYPKCNFSMNEVFFKLAKT